MTEREMREAFGELASGVRAAPDPYTRLMARSRRTTRMRAAGLTTGFAAAVAAAIFGTVGLQGMAGPNPTDGSSSMYMDNSEPINQWTRGLIDAPTRGELAADQAFINDLTNRLRTRFAPSGQLKVLFAEDVGESRIIVAARFTATHQIGISIAGHRGAGAEDLSRAATEHFQVGDVMIGALRPFSLFSGGRLSADGSRIISTSVGLAVPGCAVETAAWSEKPPVWTPAPKGDHVTSADAPGERAARVTCDGVLRYQGYLGESGSRLVRNVTDAQQKAAGGRRGRGSFPDMISRHILGSDHCDGPIEQAELIFGGTVPGVDGPPVHVGVCPGVKGGWVVAGLYEDGHGGEFVTDADMGQLSSIIVMLPPDLHGSEVYLVLAAREAVRLEVRDANGVLLETPTLGAGVGSITIPKGQTRSLKAFDAAGNEVGAGTGPTPQRADNGIEPIDNW